MISTLDILLQPPNSRVIKAVSLIRSNFHANALEKCAKLIREDDYSMEYDLNADGYITASDYDILYEKFYGKWDMWHVDSKTIDIRGMVRIKKYISGFTPVDSDYDLDDDGAVTETDLEILRRWLMLGKTEKETFNDGT